VRPAIPASASNHHPHRSSAHDATAAVPGSWTSETRLHRRIQKRKTRPVPGRIDRMQGFACRPNCAQVTASSISPKFRSRPAAPGTVGQLGHPRLALVHGGNQFQAGQPSC